MMTFDEATKHIEMVVEIKEKQVKRGDWEKDSLTERDVIKCIEEYRQVAEWLKELKALREQKRQRGEWLPQDEFEAYNKCSNCGIVIDNDFPIWRNFCPNCGADMRGEAE